MTTDVVLQIDVDDLLEIGAHMITRHRNGERSFSLSGPDGNPRVWLTADSPDDLIAAVGALSDVAADWVAERRTVSAAARMPVAAALISAERVRQIAVEGWTAEHDDEYDNGELLSAAVEYIQYAQGVADGSCWPWDQSSWKPSDDPVRNLVKAGALIAAEIDRLRRRESAGE